MGGPAARAAGAWRDAETLSVVILTRNEAENLDALLPALAKILGRAGIAYEVIVLDAASPDGTAAVARRHGVRVVQQERPGYANALRSGFAHCKGDFVLTLDADLSHGPEFVLDMIKERNDAEIVIASRYVARGGAVMPPTRRALSFMLNRLYGRTLGLPIKDLSSGFRLYRRTALAELAPRGEHFDVLPEIVALAFFRGHRVREVPFHYRARMNGVSKARVLRFAPSYVRTLLRCLAAKRRRGDG